MISPPLIAFSQNSGSERYWGILALYATIVALVIVGNV